MPKIIHINSVIGVGSTGRIMNMIHNAAVERGWESIQVFGRDSGDVSFEQSIRLGSRWSNYVDVFYSRLFDNQGLNSKYQTVKLVQFINEFQPDIVHLHNLHGYYLNYPLLFDCLRRNNVGVVWTLHDAWALTGHCAYFDFVQCEKWKNSCNKCPSSRSYPSSWLLDRSKRNHGLKKQSFQLDTMVIVSVSKWLSGLVKESFLGCNEQVVIHNGIDLNVFKPQALQLKFTLINDDNLKYILAVASPWTKRKGFSDLIEIAESIAERETYMFVVVGVSEEQKKSLPNNCITINRTNDINELAYLYAKASVFINPTYEDNYPTTNLEAIACGTPVVTYDTGGCKEALNSDVGQVVEKGNWRLLLTSALGWADKKNQEVIEKCSSWASENFDSDKVYTRYLDIYNKVLKVKLNDR